MGEGGLEKERGGGVLEEGREREREGMTKRKRERDRGHIDGTMSLGFLSIYFLHKVAS